jgi:hypothetical protein
LFRLQNGIQRKASRDNQESNHLDDAMWAGESGGFGENVAWPDLTDCHRNHDMVGNRLNGVGGTAYFNHQDVELAFLEDPAEKRLVFFVCGAR